MRVTFAKMHFPLEREISEQKSARYYSILQISSYYRSIICTHLRYWYIQWKKVTNITLSSLSSLSWSLTASSSALWKYGKFSVWTFIVCESTVTDWWVKSMTPIQVVLRSYQKSEKESLNWNEPLFLVRKCAKFHWFFAIFSNYFQFAKFHLKECHISLIFCQNSIVPNFIDTLPLFINIVPSHKGCHPFKSRTLE